MLFLFFSVRVRYIGIVGLALILRAYDFVSQELHNYSVYKCVWSVCSVPGMYIRTIWTL